jgi:hypothetical protein
MKIEKQQALQMPIPDLIAAINTGAEIVGAVKPVIDALVSWLGSLKLDALSTPHGKRLAIEAGQAVDKLHEQRMTQIEARLFAVEQTITTLAVHG